MPKNHWDIIIIGGGAAGYFSAINIKENFPELKVLILEKDKEVLKKVKISGGGRCNVTNYCFEPRELVKNYPRGNKELLGPFHSFNPADMMQWLEYHGVETKVENDNRVFPTSNKSQSIIDCFVDSARALDIKVLLSTSVNNIEHDDVKQIWEITTLGETYFGKKIVLTTGSSARMWQMIQNLGHSIVPPVASLFTFNIKHPIIRSLPGISMPNAQVKILNTSFEASGPLLITHWGLSGPAILKLSAWAARELEQVNYKFEVVVNWVSLDTKEASKTIGEHKTIWARKKIEGSPLFQIPKRLWSTMLMASSIDVNLNWADINKHQVEVLSSTITQSKFSVQGKSTFKDEFVTAGGVELSEIDFKTYESKIKKGLYFAGEVLNIDGVTGGFNFQAAWTSSWLVAQNIGA